MFVHVCHETTPHQAQPLLASHALCNWCKIKLLAASRICNMGKKAQNCGSPTRQDIYCLAGYRTIILVKQLQDALNMPLLLCQGQQRPSKLHFKSRHGCMEMEPTLQT